MRASEHALMRLDHSRPVCARMVFVAAADRDFEAANINNKDFSHMVGDWQVSGYVLLPWQFLEIELIFVHIL